MRSDNSRFIHIFPVAIIDIYLFAFDYLPLQDYPNWLYQGFVFKEYFFFGNDFTGFFSLHPYIPPNAISTVAIGVLSSFFAPILAGKLFLFATLLLNYFGVYSFLLKFSRTSKFTNSLVAVYFLFNLYFLIGNISFLFGLGATLCGFVYLYRRSKLASIPHLIPLYIICYFSHFLTAVILAILIFSFYSTEEKKRMLLRNVIAALPIIALFIHYSLLKMIVTFDPHELENTVWQMTLAKFVVVSVSSIPFHRYKAVIELADVLKYINYIVAGTAILSIFTSLKYIIINKVRGPLPIAIGFFVGFLIVLPYEIGGLYFPAERFMIILFVAMIAFLSGHITNRTIRKIAVAALLFLTLASLTYNFMAISKFNAMVAEGATPSPSEQMVFKYKEGSDPFTQLEYYKAIEEKRPMPIFTTSLFTYRGANPKTFDGK